jgi:hypothetical protein
MPIHKYANTVRVGIKDIRTSRTNHPHNASGQLQIFNEPPNTFRGSGSSYTAGYGNSSRSGLCMFDTGNVRDYTDSAGVASMPFYLSPSGASYMLSTETAPNATNGSLGVGTFDSLESDPHFGLPSSSEDPSSLCSTVGRWNAFQSPGINPNPLPLNSPAHGFNAINQGWLHHGMQQN